MRAIVLAVLCCLASAYGHAQTRYVSDEVFVPVRSGAGFDYRIIYSRLKSGQTVTLLEQNDEWARVRLQSGTEGWVPREYLSSEPTARTQLEAAQTQLAAANERVQALQSELASLREQHESLSSEAQVQASECEICTEELNNLKALSADAVNLNQRYQELLATHSMMQTDRDALRAERDALKSDKTISHWLFGAGLLILGMILMLILPAIKPKKRHSDWVD